MKEFKENYDPISVKLIDINGNEYTITTKFLTMEKYKEIENLSVDKTTTMYEIATKTMILTCGETEEFWDKFSIQMLTGVAKYLADEMIKKKLNPG